MLRLVTFRYDRDYVWPSQLGKNCLALLKVTKQRTSGRAIKLCSLLIETVGNPSLRFEFYCLTHTDNFKEDFR